MNCPFCGCHQNDLFALSLHLDDEHPGRERELVVAISPGHLTLPVMEGVDIDRVHHLYGAITPAASARAEG